MAPAPPIQTEATLEAPLDVVWSAAVEWFAANDMPIKNLDKASGLIATDYKMSIDRASQLMFCGQSGPNPQGKIEHVEHRGNFNLVLREQPDGTTRAKVNAFFGCTVQTYKYVGILSADLQLESTAQKDCTSTGRVEKQLLEHLAGIEFKRSPPGPADTAPEPVAAPAPVAPAPTVAPTPAASPSACASDADCRAGRVCRDGGCTTPSCAKDVDCPEPQICDAGVCKQP